MVLGSRSPKLMVVLARLAFRIAACECVQSNHRLAVEVLTTVRPSVTTIAPVHPPRWDRMMRRTGSTSEAVGTVRAGVMTSSDCGVEADQFDNLGGDDVHRVLRGV